MPLKGNIPRACRQCGGAFFSTQDRIDSGRGLYCGRVCKDAAQSNSVDLVCETCGRSFRRKRSLVRDRTYCSHPCRANPKPAPVILSDDGLTARLPLQARDGTITGYTVIDTADVEWAQQWRWHMNPASGRVMRNGELQGRRQAIYLHRELMGLIPGDGLEIDHVDRNPLNNQRDNLRIATRAQNAQNLPVRTGATSRYRGVAWSTQYELWLAYAHVNGKRVYSAYFEDEAEAAEAARAARRRLMPFATD